MTEITYASFLGVSTLIITHSKESVFFYPPLSVHSTLADYCWPSAWKEWNVLTSSSEPEPEPDPSHPSPSRHSMVLSHAVALSHQTTKVAFPNLTTLKVKFLLSQDGEIQVKIKEEIKAFILARQKLGRPLRKLIVHMGISEMYHSTLQLETISGLKELMEVFDGLQVETGDFEDDDLEWASSRYAVLDD